jgi:hypothetical protein
MRNEARGTHVYNSHNLVPVKAGPEPMSLILNDEEALRRLAVVVRQIQVARHARN